MCDMLKIPYHIASFPEDCTIQMDGVKQLLEKRQYSLVTVVHCETSSGVINPITELGCQLKSVQPGELTYILAYLST